MPRRAKLVLTVFDKEGFLLNIEDWNHDVAEQIASAEGICLGSGHWEVVELLRRYYKRYEASPAMRALVKYAARELGPEKGHSIYLLGLFPGSPARIACKIAGLPKPENCL
jgi:tRNA 2-thiouridine synthesizing protein E